MALPPIIVRLLGLEAHAANKSNPHGVTLAQVGAAPAGHISDRNNPHGVTAIQVGTYTKAEIDEMEGGGFNTRQILTTSGPFTAPVSGCYKVTCIGGGGPGGAGVAAGTTTSGSGSNQSSSSSGGGAGGGGGAGYIETGYFHLTAGQSISVTIGAGGGVTSFGSLLSANPGGAGGNASAGAGGLGGSGGGNGSNGNANQVSTNIPAGSSLRVTLGNGSGGVGGSNGTIYGRGANGRSGSAAATVGGAGAVILEYYDRAA